MASTFQIPLLTTQAQAREFFSDPTNAAEYRKQPNGELMFEMFRKQGWVPETVSASPASAESATTHSPTPEPPTSTVASAEVDDSFAEPAETSSEPAPIVGGVQNPPTAEQIAERYIGLGAYVYFCPFGSKVCHEDEWQNKATRDLLKARQIIAGRKLLNVMLVGKRDGLWTLDFDDLSILDEYENIYGPIKTRKHRSPSGGIHLPFLPSEAAWQTGNIGGKDEHNRETFSVRINDRYVLAPGSAAYPNNDPTKPLTFYEVVDDSPVIEAPLSLLEFLKAKTGKQKESVPVTEDVQIVEGGRNNYLTSKLGKARQDFGMDFEQLHRLGCELNDKHCVPALSNGEVETIARSVSKYAVNPGDIVLTQSTDAFVAPEAFNANIERFAISDAERERRLENDEFPVLPLVAPFVPEWDDDVMYGIAGEIIRKASQYCEAHPAGMFLDLVVGLGNIIGPKPYFNINKTRHHTNEYMARIGDTSDSRKGTGRDIVDDLLRVISGDWFGTRIMNGFGSAEAVVNELRDPMQHEVRDKKAATGFRVIATKGVDDKRLCIREGELASVFLLASKPDSRFDIIIRDGWDGKPLRNIVKGKSRDGLSNSASCQEPHISISGDTTRSELLSKLPKGAAENGFGNRFLYCYVYRTKLCPNGGPELDWSAEIPRLYEVIEFAKNVGYVPLSKAAAKMWARMYVEVDSPENKLTGLAGAMTARAAAHIRRLALIYTLLDKSTVTESRHLQAAKRMWDYCEASARFIFNGTTSSQDRITQFVMSRGSVTITEIVQELFHKNRTVESVRLQLAGLVERDRFVNSGVRIKGDTVYFEIAK